MPFTEQELKISRRLSDLGLQWNPQPGHYVLDHSQLIEPDSPFQDRVYFILDLKHFLRRAGTIEQLKQRVCWLPTWEQMRELLRQQGIDNQAQLRHLLANHALDVGLEREALYQLLEATLSQAAT